MVSIVIYIEKNVKIFLEIYIIIIGGSVKKRNKNLSTKRMIAVALSTTIVTSSAPIDAIYAEIKENKQESKLDQKNTITPTSELPFTEINIKDKGDIWENDSINLTAKLKDSTTVSSIEIKYDNNSILLEKNPYNSMFENPRINTYFGDYKATEIIFNYNDSSKKTITRNTTNESIFSEFDYNVNKHEVKSIEINPKTNITQGDKVEISVDITGKHKADSLYISYRSANGNYLDGIYANFDEDKQKFIGYIDVPYADNYKLNYISIYKNNYNISIDRYDNEDMFSKGDFIVNKYYYPIENIEIENKENLRYLDKMTIKASLKDGANVDEIEEIELNYSPHGEIKLQKNIKNEFVGEAYVTEYTKKPQSISTISIKKAGGTYVTYNRNDIGVHAQNLDINPKLPFDSINIENKQNEYYKGENIDIFVTNASDSLYSINVYYENDESMVIHRNHNIDDIENFKGNINLNKSGDYKVRSISFEGQGRINLSRDEIPKEILENLEFNVKQYFMPITSINVEQKDNIKIFDKVKLNASVADNEISKIKLLTERNQEIVLNKTTSGTLEGTMEAKYENDKIQRITVFKNDREFNFSGIDIRDLKDSISISDFKMPFDNIQIENKENLYVGDTGKIKIEGVGDNIEHIDIHYDGRSPMYIYNHENFEESFDITNGNYNIRLIDVYDKDGERFIIKRQDLSQDILSNIEFSPKGISGDIITSANIENKDNLALFDDSKISMELKDNSNTSKIEVIYNDGKRVELNKVDNKFEGTLNSLNNQGHVSRIYIYRNNGNILTLYSYQLSSEILNSLNYITKIPVKSVEMNKENLSQGSGSNIKVNLLDNKIDKINRIILNYDNGKRVELDKEKEFKSYIDFDYSGNYNISSIEIISEDGYYSYYNNQMSQDLQKMFNFNVSEYDLGIKSINLENNEIASVGQSKITLDMKNPDLVKSIRISYDGYNHYRNVDLEYNKETNKFEGLISGETFSKGVLNRIEQLEVVLNNDVESKIIIPRHVLENSYKLDLSNTDFTVVVYRPIISDISVENNIEYGQGGKFRVKVSNPNETLSNIKLVYGIDSKKDETISIDLYKSDTGPGIYEGQLEYEDINDTKKREQLFNITTGKYKLKHAIAGNYLTITKNEFISNGVELSKANFNISEFKPKIDRVTSNKRDIDLGETVRIDVNIPNLQKGFENVVEPKLIYKSAELSKSFDIKYDENNQAYVEFKCDKVNEVRQWKLDGISFKTGNNYNTETSYIPIQEFEQNGAEINNKLINVQRPTNIDMKSPEISSRVDSNATYIKGKTKPNGYVVIRNRDVSLASSIIGQGYADKNGDFNIKIAKQNQGDKLEIFTIIDDKNYGSYLTESTFVTVKRFEGEIIAKDKTIVLGSEFNPLTDVKAVNRDGEDITSSIKVVSENVNTSKKGNYTVTYTAKDNNNNDINKTINVIVADKNEMLSPGLDEKINPNSKHIIGTTLENAHVVVTMKNKAVKSLDEEEIVAEGKSDSKGVFKLTISDNAPILENGDNLEIVAHKTLENGAIFTTLTTNVRVGKDIPQISATDRVLTVGDKFDPRESISATYEGKEIDKNKIEVIKNDVNMNVAGEYTVIYSVTVDGETNTKTIKVNVKEKEILPQPPIDQNPPTTSPQQPEDPKPPVQKPSVPPTVEVVSAFKDVKGHWAESHIELFRKKGFINGYENGTFKPNNNMTRAEFIKIVNKVFGFTEKGIESFDDVNKNDWYYSDICIAVKAGYIKGKTEKRFAPNDKMTRQEASMILTNIKKNKDSNLDKLNGFNDGKDTSDWAKSSVEGAIESGYLVGDENKNIKSKGYITRAEAITMLSRVK